VLIEEKNKGKGYIKRQLILLKGGYMHLVMLLMLPKLLKKLIKLLAMDMNTGLAGVNRFVTQTCIFPYGINMLK
jgi:hypothetical protein